MSGLLLIVLGAAAHPSHNSFPGWWALLPVARRLPVHFGRPGRLDQPTAAGFAHLRLVRADQLSAVPLALAAAGLCARARERQRSGARRSHCSGPCVDPAGLDHLPLCRAAASHSTRFNVVRRPRAGSMVLVAVVGALVPWASAALAQRRSRPAGRLAASADWAYPDGMRTVKVEGETIYRVGEGGPTCC